MSNTLHGSLTTLAMMYAEVKEEQSLGPRPEPYVQHWLDESGYSPRDINRVNEWAGTLTLTDMHNIARASDPLATLEVFHDAPAGTTPLINALFAWVLDSTAPADERSQYTAYSLDAKPHVIKADACSVSMSGALVFTVADKVTHILAPGTWLSVDLDE